MTLKLKGAAVALLGLSGCNLLTSSDRQETAEAPAMQVEAAATTASSAATPSLKPQASAAVTPTLSVPAPQVAAVSAPTIRPESEPEPAARSALPPAALRPTIAQPTFASFAPSAEPAAPAEEPVGAPAPAAAREPTPQVVEIQTEAADGDVWVQLGAYSNPALAEEMWRQKSSRQPELFADLAPTVTVAATSAHGDMHRLRVGPFGKGDAEALCAQIVGDCAVADW